MARPKNPTVQYPAQPRALLPEGGSAEEVERPKKKPKTRSVTSKVKGKKGAMEIFNSLPIDLLYEVASNLHPADLFALSNTSKVFRNVVTGASSSALWSAARERVGLPELELANMTNLQYGQLLFGKGCSFCPRKNAGKPDPYYRARICTGCFKEHFACQGTAHGNAAISKAVGGQEHMLTLLTCKTTSVYRLAELASVNDQLRNEFPESSHSSADRSFASRLRLRARGLNLVDEEPVPASAFQEWYAAGEKDRLARYADGTKIRVWLQDQENEKANDKEGIRKARLEELTRRFELQGFHQTEVQDWGIRNDALVKEPKAVTARTWPRLEEQLKPKLYEIRRKNRISGLGTSYFSTKRARPDGQYLPPSEMLGSLAAVKALVDDVSTFVDADQLWDDHGAAIMSEIAALLRSRREEMLRELASAYDKLRQGHQRKEPSTITGLLCSDIELPRLPPWIPRDSSVPIVASDEQIAVFLEHHPLAFFECNGCRRLKSGSDIIRHCGDKYICFYREDYYTQPDKWLRVNSPADSSMHIDRDVLLVSLKLRQLLASAPAEAPDEQVEQDVAEYNIEDMPTKDKYTAFVDCKCLEGNAWSWRRAHFADVAAMYTHIRERHVEPSTKSVALEASVEYSMAFCKRMRAAGHPVGGHDDQGYDSFRDPFGFGYDGYDGMDAYGAGYYSDDSMDTSEEERNECTIM
ncbi:hypothetical protein JCM11641_001180 [Rhodosporidiobolus odoratus]